MTSLERLQGEPWAHDFLLLLRLIERSHPERPRIGDSTASEEDVVRLGEDPFLDFPASNVSRAEQDASGRLRVFVKFLGLLGPQGPLPLATTSEAYGWALARDDAFPRFLDLFNNRFLQLFYRAWADARPIAQHERPDLDRFDAYVGSQIGIGSEPYRGRDSIPDRTKLAFAGLLGAKAKSPVRLRNAIEGLFGVEVDVEEYVGVFLPFDPADRSRLGQAHARLGSDLLVGASVYSIEDKFRIVLDTNGLEQYERFLPSGDHCKPLADLVFFFVGHELEWDLQLGLPASAVAPMQLGRFGRVGYTSWLQKRPPASAEGYRRDARFSPAERVTKDLQAKATRV